MVELVVTKWSQKMIGPGLDVMTIESDADLQVPRNVLRAKPQSLSLPKTNVTDVLFLSSNSRRG
jgi:hypothetical protein